MDGAESDFHTSTFNQDVRQIMLVKKEPPEEQSAYVDQQDPEHLHIKEEQEELWSSLEGEQLHLKEETDAARFPLTAVSIKSEDDEVKPLFSQLHQQQTEDRDVPTSSSVDQMTAETSRNLDLHPHKQTSDSSETEVSGDDKEEGDVNLDSQLLDSGPETEDGDTIYNKSHRHMLVHTGKKPFPCELCGKTFNHEASLNMHMNIHTGQMPFACEICGQRFRQKPNLNKHLSAHAEQKPLACELCKIIFSRKTTLINHMRVHRERKPFACKICGQIFSQKTSLNTHMSVHTGEKPFACELCGQRFSQRTNLNRHTSVHTGQRPFACDFCGQRFSLKHHLNRHRSVHTGQKPFACDHLTKQCI